MSKNKMVKNLELEVPRACRGAGWVVYIAKASTGRYYVGITNNIVNRIDKHNKGKGSKMAIQQGPFKLVYKSRYFNSKSEARKREVQIKKWSRNKKEKLISGEWE